MDDRDAQLRGRRRDRPAPSRLSANAWSGSDFGLVDRRIGRGIDDHVGTEIGKRLCDRAPVAADRPPAARQSRKRHLVPAPQLHAASARPALRAPITIIRIMRLRLSQGRAARRHRPCHATASTSHSLSRYQRTVFSMPVSNVSCARQPSSVSSLVASIA